MKISEVIDQPQDNHALVRAPGYAAWGMNHDYSSRITGEAAKLMGVPDYRQAEITPQLSKLTSAFLDAINNSSGSPETLYHGFQNRKGTQWKVGMELRLPLMAAGGTIDTASYGMRLNPADNEGPPTVFEFPRGTPMAGYNKWKK